MRKPTPLDLKYNPRLSVPNAQEYIEQWATASERTRSSTRAFLDVPFGSSPSEKLDLFLPTRRSRALLVFFHGGYWRSRSRQEFSFVADAFVDADVAVAIPGYALCPSVRVSDIVMQSVQAIAWLYRNGRHFGIPPENIVVSGHSAGGHLAAMAMTCLWPLFSSDLPDNLLKGAILISGLFDLRDLVNTPSINSDVRLSMAEAHQVSPAFMPPAHRVRAILMVGEKETAGFHKQHAILKSRWTTSITAEYISSGDNHFSVLDRFSHSGSQLNAGALKLLDEKSQAARSGSPNGMSA